MAWLAFAVRKEPEWVLCFVFALFIKKNAHLVMQKCACLCARPSVCRSVGLVKEGQPDGESDLIACRFEIKMHTLRTIEATFNQTAVNCPSICVKDTCSSSTIPPDSYNIKRQKPCFTFCIKLMTGASVTSFSQLWNYSSAVPDPYNEQ